LPTGSSDRPGPNSFALFSPRLRWAAALDFLAQLVREAQQCVCFTAAFGISKEMAPALLGGDEVPKYILLESEGNWPSSREAIWELGKLANVRLAFGTHIEALPSASRYSWQREDLTGLNQHVKYVHTKILLIDPFSDEPVIVSGSANFSRASMESNDENLIVVRGDKDLADTVAAEFFRIFGHMRYRNELEEEHGLCGRGGSGPHRRIQGKQPPPKEWAARAVSCGAGEDAAEAASCKVAERGHGEEAIVEKPADGREADLWPERCFNPVSFECLERRKFAQLCLPVLVRPADAAEAALPSDTASLEAALAAAGAVTDEEHVEHDLVENHSGRDEAADEVQLSSFPVAAPCGDDSSTAAPSNSPNGKIPGIWKMRKAELQELCRARGLRSEGLTVPELRAQLRGTAE